MKDSRYVTLNISDIICTNFKYNICYAAKVRGAALEVVDALQLQMLRLEAQLVDLKLQLLVEKVLA
jgi:hypothetical protein